MKQDAAQLIHGDLTGNVLFAADEAPAVIDFSPYWRPPVFAEAVVVADGLLWFQAYMAVHRSNVRGVR